MAKKTTGEVVDAVSLVFRSGGRKAGDMANAVAALKVGEGLIVGTIASNYVYCASARFSPVRYSRRKTADGRFAIIRLPDVVPPKAP